MPSLSPNQIKELQARYTDLRDYGDDGAVKLIHPLDYRDADGDTLLHVAACRNDTEAVSWLLHGGADPNVIGDMGTTALHWATDNNNIEMAALLISFGARADVVDEFGRASKPSGIDRWE